MSATSPSSAPPNGTLVTDFDIGDINGLDLIGAVDRLAAQAPAAV